jgi:hypothetical protein
MRFRNQHSASIVLPIKKLPQVTPVSSAGFARRGRHALSLLSVLFVILSIQSRTTRTRVVTKRVSVGKAIVPGPESAAADLSFLGPSWEPGSLGRLDHYEVLEVVGRGGFGMDFIDGCTWKPCYARPGRRRSRRSCASARR